MVTQITYISALIPFLNVFISNATESLCSFLSSFLAVGFLLAKAVVCLLIHCMNSWDFNQRLAIYSLSFTEMQNPLCIL
jgi:hypothetical protein